MTWMLSMEQMESLNEQLKELNRIREHNAALADERDRLRGRCARFKVALQVLADLGSETAQEALAATTEAGDEQ